MSRIARVIAGKMLSRPVYSGILLAIILGLLLAKIHVNIYPTPRNSGITGYVSVNPILFDLTVDIPMLLSIDPKPKEYIDPWASTWGERTPFSYDSYSGSGCIIYYYAPTGNIRLLTWWDLNLASYPSGQNHKFKIMITGNYPTAYIETIGGQQYYTLTSKVNAPVTWEYYICGKEYNYYSVYSLSISSSGLYRVTLRIPVDYTTTYNVGDNTVTLKVTPLPPLKPNTMVEFYGGSSLRTLETLTLGATNNYLNAWKYTAQFLGSNSTTIWWKITLEALQNMDSVTEINVFFKANSNAFVGDYNGWRMYQIQFSNPVSIPSGYLIEITVYLRVVES